MKVKVFMNAEVTDMDLSATILEIVTTRLIKVENKYGNFTTSRDDKTYLDGELVSENPLVKSFVDVYNVLRYGIPYYCEE